MSNAVIPIKTHVHLSANVSGVGVLEQLDSSRFKLSKTTGNPDYAASFTCDPNDLLICLVADEANLSPLAERLGGSRPNCPLVVLIEDTLLSAAWERIGQSVSDIMPMSVDAVELELRLTRAHQAGRHAAEITWHRQYAAMNYGYDNLVGISAPVAKIKESVRRIADTDITVLITGPTGCGKSLLARIMHYHSARKNGPFVTIDFSTFPDKIHSRMLFGDAESREVTAPLLAQASGGTIFLEEIGEMSADAQTGLLTFIQTGRLPDSKADTPRLNVRLLSASSANMAEQVASKGFREDLFYRLDEIPLEIPQLADRSEDIEVLCAYFLRRLSMDYEKGELALSQSAIDKLCRYPWPGNVRELENTLRRSIALSQTDVLEAADIRLQGQEGHEKTEPGQEESSERTLTIRGGLLDDSQRTLIMKALNDHKWNFTRTAEHLGIGRTTLWRKIKKYNLQKEAPAE